MSLDVIAIGKAQKYTDISVEGAGAIKGKNCVVSSTVIEGGHRVTVGWYRDSDDAYQEFYFDVMDGVDGADGKDGKDGVDGVQPVLSIGTVTKGTTASATITGTAADPKLNLVLPQGDTGVGIVSIAKTDTSGIIDTYTVTYSNGNTDTFTVTNGDSVVSASVDDFNNLSFTMASGNGINVGQIQLKGQQGYFPCGAELIWNGTTAPQGFLMCDGSEYLKTAYPQLAAFLAATDTAQGTTYFAGSDSAHFKVPDAKGEYYRGAGTNSHTGQGNGGLVGEHQDATEHREIANSSSTTAVMIGRALIQNYDGRINPSSVEDANAVFINGSAAGGKLGAYYARPTSTSKNYIIAYQDIYLAPRHQYSTEEHVVGTWIDGRPVYEITNEVTKSQMTKDADYQYSYSLSNLSIDNLVDSSCVGIPSSGNAELYLPFIPYNNNGIISNYGAAYELHPATIALTAQSTTMGRINGIRYTIQYTKTTDIVS